MRKDNIKLTDNPNVPVYHYRKFLPKDYKPIKDNSRLLDKECYIFHNEDEQRVAVIKVAKDCFWLECYYVEPFPYGIFYNIDWNDTLFLENCKIAGNQGSHHFHSRLYPELFPAIPHQSHPRHHPPLLSQSSPEGDFDILMDIVKGSQKIAIEAGANSLMTYIKMNYNPNEGILAIDEKIGKYSK